MSSKVELGRLYAAIGVSGVVLLAALYVILSGKYDPDYSKWAFGTVGVVLGDWLK